MATKYNGDKNINGKQCKSLRKALGMKKPTSSAGGYYYFDVTVWQWGYVKRSNPTMNLYRRIKRTRHDNYSL